MRNILTWSIVLIGLLIFSGACTVKVAPVEVKPIHITIDVNVRVDRALDDFFGDIDKAEEKMQKSDTK